MEIAGSVLHDIGNAITGISTSVSRLLSDDEWPEIQELQRLRVLLDSQSGALSTALGEARERALRDFVRQLTEKLEERRDELVESYQGMANIVGHISETLAVQRQYASEWVSGDRPRVSLQQLVADALAMQQASFEKRGIRVENSEGGPGDEGAQSAGGAGGGVGAISLEGDRTKLVRVFVNILKNAAESFDCRGRSGGPSAGPRTHPGAAEADADAESSARVTITLSTDGAGYARVRIADNGCGFDAEPGDDVTAEGYTSKDSSRGIGLYSAKRIVEGHGGSLQVSSPGLGAGSTVVVTLPTAAPHGRSEHGRTEQERS
jgi:signal transduction histidine kinase